MFGEALGGGLTYEVHEFTIAAADGFGTPVTTGGDDITVEVAGPNEFTPTVIDNDDGTYTVRFEADLGGFYEIDASLQSMLFIFAAS